MKVRHREEVVYQVASAQREHTYILQCTQLSIPSAIS